MILFAIIVAKTIRMSTLNRLRPTIGDDRNVLDQTFIKIQQKLSSLGGILSFKINPTWSRPGVVGWNPLKQRGRHPNDGP